MLNGSLLFCIVGLGLNAPSLLTLHYPNNPFFTAEQVLRFGFLRFKVQPITLLSSPISIFSHLFHHGDI